MNEKTYADLLADTENTWDYPDDEDSDIDAQYVDGEKVEYKIIFGNDNIVFIKAGAEEDVYKGAPGLDPELEYEGIEELLADKN